MQHVAITRKVSRSLAHCELTHLSRRPIDVTLARTQHAAYEDVLREAGCQVQQLEELADFPDSVFVEDTAVVLDEVAVLTRPGAASRRGEVDSVEAALASYRELRRIVAPGTLDGGDVLRLGHVIHVGETPRSNADGVAQLRRFVAPFGYRVQTLPVHGCLHLKSAVTAIGPDLLLVNPEWVDVRRFVGIRCLAVHPSEPHAANALALSECVVYSTTYPRTSERLRDAGTDVRTVEMSETEKAEGAVTCCSVVLDIA